MYILSNLSEIGKHHGLTSYTTKYCSTLFTWRALLSKTFKRMGAFKFRGAINALSQFTAVKTKNQKRNQIEAI